MLQATPQDVAAGALALPRSDLRHALVYHPQDGKEIVLAQC